MEFEWDEAKNAANLKKHGISFEEASLIFEGPTILRADDRFNYGELRWVSIGKIREVVAVVVVHTDRNGKTRIISARMANHNERELYDEYY